MTEVAQDVHRIEVPLGDRYVCLYLLTGDAAALLVDSGVACSPVELATYAHAIGFDLGRVRYVLTSHADFDHSGGNGAVRDLCPAAIFLCHELDRRLVEDVEALIGLRYGEYVAEHGIDDGDDARELIRASSRHVPVDLALVGGERLRLGTGWEVEILHTPGHTRGMIALLVDGKEVFTGDTLFKNSVGGVRAVGHTTYGDLKRSIMDVLLELPPATTIRPGHTDPTTVADEWENNAFVRVWRGLDEEGAAPCTAMGEPATLVLLGDDYDGGHKAWVRWPDGSDDIVPGSQVSR
jgi:glyoxylase-like metal-dependent hydrolase (beta-lactamase superfamily II)